MDRLQQLRDLSQWDEDYIASLPSAELDWIDYKGSDKFADPAFANDISKYASAWGNYDGGYIVFGVQDPKDGTALRIDGGVPLTAKPNLLNWIDDLIPTLVDPPLPKISSWLIHPRADHSQIAAGHVLVVVHIPESAMAPHQARDRKYYQRVGRRLEPLRHRAILDIIGRRRHPTLRTKLIVHIGNVREPTIFWQLENTGKSMALHWKAVIRFPTKIGKSGVTVPDERPVIGRTEDGRSFVEFRVSKALGSPLFPGSDISNSFKLAGVEYEPPLEPSIDYAQVTTFADDMPPLVEQFPIGEVLKQH